MVSVGKWFLRGIVVIAVCALIAAIIIPTIGKVAAPAVHTKISSELRQLALFLKDMRSDVGSYPDDITVEYMNSGGFSDPIYHDYILDEGFRYIKPPDSLSIDELKEDVLVIILYSNDLGHWAAFTDGHVEYLGD